MAGDCCDGACALEAAGSACDDGAVCTTGDACQAGSCVGGGWKYKDRDRTPNGILTAVLKAKASGAATLKVKGKGALLPAVPLPLAQDANVTVQLVGDQGTCWETTHAAPAKRSDPTQFVDGQD